MAGALVLSACTPAPAVGSLKTYPISPGPFTSGTSGCTCADGLTVGPDNNLWIAENNFHVARMTTSGVVTQFRLPLGSQTSRQITTGPDNALWLTDGESGSSGAIIRVTTSGAATRYPLPPGSTEPFAIATGPDGHLWFTTGGPVIGRMTTSGAMTTVKLPDTLDGEQGYGWPGIVTGPDGNLWITTTTSHIVRMTTSGAFTSFTLPTGVVPTAITRGPDGGLWFGTQTRQVGRIATNGATRMFTVPTSPKGRIPHGFDYINGITSGADGNLWWASPDSGTYGRVTPAGVTTTYDLPSENTIAFDGHVGMVNAPDGAVWFTDDIQEQRVVVK